MNLKDSRQVKKGSKLFGGAPCTAKTDTTMADYQYQVPMQQRILDASQVSSSSTQADSQASRLHTSNVTQAHLSFSNSNISGHLNTFIN